MAEHTSDERTKENESESTAASGTQKPRHTMEEKRTMRILRKKRNRQAIATAKEAKEGILKVCPI